MNEFSEGIGFSFSGPAIYRIEVQGKLDEHWSARLAGLSITQIKKLGRRPRTVLTGKIRDQAELSGVLESLYELHLAIIRVETIEQEDN